MECKVCEKALLVGERAFRLVDAEENETFLCMSCWHVWHVAEEEPHTLQ